MVINLRESVKNKCDLFADNYSKIKSDFKWNDTPSLRLGALLYALESKSTEEQAIRYCKAIIKENTGVFSQFKQTTFFIVATILSLKNQPKSLIQAANKIYHDMKKAGFHSSPYLVLSALYIALQKESWEFPHIIARAKRFYDGMKQQHPFITSSDDYGFATLLAMTDRDVNSTIREIESYYSKLKENFSNSNGIQALSQVLIFGEGDTNLKCNQVVELNRALKNRQCKFGSGTQLSFLGVMSLLNEDSNRLADEVAQTNEYLKTKKGFGYWSISAKERLMYATALVSRDYLDDLKKDTMGMALANQVTEIILAQQLTMIAIASSASATAAASSN